jgi:flagellin-like protein
MNFKQLLKDDDAVSPVIGVILMVAITVILAAVIGTFVLGLGDQVQQTAPNAQFSFDYDKPDDGDLTITHDGGSSIDGSQLSVRNGGSTWDVDNPPANSDFFVSDGSSDITAGTSMILETSDYDDTQEVRVVWTSDDGGQSSTLATWDGV